MSHDDPGRAWFEEVWEYREESLYPSLFGTERRGTFLIPPAMFTETFRQDSFDPRWLHFGVFEFAPIESRSSWLYVTSGMSNEWWAESPNPTPPSGLGCEFVLETKDASQWAILRLLHAMTFQILICHGSYPGLDPLGEFDRIPLRGSIRPEPSPLKWLMLAPPSGYPREATLNSGTFDFYEVVGISDAEAAFARDRGGPSLLHRLSSAGYFPVTDPDRPEVVLGPD